MKFFRATSILVLLSCPASAFLAFPRRHHVASHDQGSLQMVLDSSMAERLNSIKRSYQALTERLGDPDVIGDNNLMRRVMSDRASIEDTVTAYDEYVQLQQDLEGAKELFQSDDSEMKEMAREEMKEIEPQMDALEDKIKILLLPKDPNDERNIMLEIRAGTGGSEANIFAGRTSLWTKNQGWTGMECILDIATRIA
jgi:peptide chain release factor 1